MKTLDSNKITQSVQKSMMVALQDAENDPKAFAAFMEAWNMLCDVDRRGGQAMFSNVQATAINGLIAVPEASGQTIFDHQVSQMLNHFAHPAFLVNEAGKVLVQNEAAFSAYDLATGDYLGALPMDMDADEPLTQSLSACFSDGRPDGDSLLRRAYGPDGEVFATLAITPAGFQPNGDKQAIVFIVSSRWSVTASDLLMDQYDLTKTEAELLTQFLQGDSLETMALHRGRSVATVRTQFYKLMSKMDVRNQTELLRVALSINQFTDKVTVIAKMVRHPLRKRIDMMRPAGRTVQVTLAGDLAGTPVVFLGSCLTHTWTPKFERKFRDFGICAISICRPGFGDTDPPLAGQDELRTFARDLSALLDQLGSKNCVIVATNTTPPTTYKLASIIPEMISGLVQVSGCIPTRYAKHNRSASKWAQGAIQAATQNPALRAFMIRSGVRAWRALGQERFHKMQFSKHPQELALVLEPDILEETQGALETATKQGYHRATADLLQAFGDFSSDISSCPLPVLIIHGDQNLIYPISSVRALAQDYPDKINLIEVPDAGFTLMATHLDVMLGHIKDIARDSFSLSCAE